MRYRRVSCRYSELSGEVARVFAADSWELVRPRVLASPFFRPAADFLETDDAYLVTLELPGVAEDDIDVFLHPDALVVAGRRRCLEIKGARWHAAEIRYGPFRFGVALPADADPDTIDASSDRGLVRVSLRKRTGGGA